IDRSHLEKYSCECYKVVKNEFGRLFSKLPVAPALSPSVASVPYTLKKVLTPSEADTDSFVLTRKFMPKTAGKVKIGGRDETYLLK
ncbi:MAG: hypothetical protein ACXWJD_06585, partial [Burkholderiaceae bacterium]